MTDGDESASAAGAARRALAARVPAWAALLVVLVVAAALIAVVVVQRRSSVDLGPVIGGAQHVEVRVDICNGEVDQREINPRQAELDLQDTLTGEGAEDARVRVERRDCPDDDATTDR